MTKTNQVIHINENKEYLIESINTDDNYLVYLDNPIVKIKYNLKNTHTNIIFINNTNEDITIDDGGIIDQNAEVKIMFIDLDKHEYHQDSKIDVYGESSLKVETKFLTSSKRDVKMFYQNIDHHTQIEIDNSCVSMDQSILNFECIGKIVKGAKYSVNKQTSRCLTIDHPQKALVKPVLLIDENEVEAAHALSSGTIDPDVLYYLNSRGINYQQAMNLIIHSYLLPRFDEIAMFGDQAKALIDSLTKKVV